MFEIILAPGVEKDLTRLQKADRKLFKQLASALDQLAANPYLGKGLAGNLKGYHSHRVRDYRILYRLANDQTRVLVLKIEHRKQVYR